LLFPDLSAVGHPAELNSCLKSFRETVGELEKPPLITVLKVAGLANPLCLIEIDAIAVVEEN